MLKTQQKVEIIGDASYSSSDGLSLEETQQKWSLLASNWTQAAPPASPSPGDIEHYFEDTSAGDQVLVLGVTPSLREAASSKGLMQLSVDCTPEMILRTSELVSQRNKRSVVLGDWRRLPLPANSVDRVLGDKVLGNLMPQDWPILFAELSRVLKPRGRFVTRATPHGKERLVLGKGRQLRESLQFWAERHEEGLHINSASAGLWEDLMDASTEYVTHQLGTQQLSRSIPKTREECLAFASRVSESTMVMEALIQRFWASRHAKWSAYCEDAIPNAAKPYFRFVGLRRADDYEAAQRQPCFVLEVESS